MAQFLTPLESGEYTLKVVSQSSGSMQAANAVLKVEKRGGLAVLASIVVILIAGIGTIYFVRRKR